MEIIYTFEGDKMVSIVNNNIFETNEDAKEYYDLLIENGTPSDSIKLEGNTISSDGSSNLEFYSSYTKEQFLDLMNSTIE